MPCRPCVEPIHCGAPQVHATVARHMGLEPHTLVQYNVRWQYHAGVHLGAGYVVPCGSLEVPVHDALRVEVHHTAQELTKEIPHGGWRICALVLLNVFLGMCELS